MYKIYTLTDNQIIEILNENLSELMEWQNYMTSIFFIAYLMVLLFSKLRGVKIGLKNNIICLILALIFGVVMDLPEFLEKRAIEYSLKNGTWYVKEDIVYEKGREIALERYEGYTIYFKNSGKLATDKHTSYDYHKGEKVYLIIAKRGFGKEYIIEHVDRNYYYYKDAIPFDENINERRKTVQER